MVVERERGTGADSDVRTRAITAARALAEEGGYEAVQMRDVVRMSGLSSSTIYRYFSSKDHLLAAVCVEWVRELTNGQVRLLATDVADRIAFLLHLSCEAVARSPRLGRAIVLCGHSSDPGVRECFDEADAVSLELFLEVIGDQPFDVNQVLIMLGAAWKGALLSWVRGQLSIDEVDTVLQAAARHLIAGAKALGDDAPSARAAQA